MMAPVCVGLEGLSLFQEVFAGVQERTESLKTALGPLSPLCTMPVILLLQSLPCLVPALTVPSSLTLIAREKKYTASPPHSVCMCTHTCTHVCVSPLCVLCEHESHGWLTEVRGQPQGVVHLLICVSGIKLIRLGIKWLYSLTTVFYCVTFIIVIITFIYILCVFELSSSIVSQYFLGCSNMYHHVQLIIHYVYNYCILKQE